VRDLVRGSLSLLLLLSVLGCKAAPMLTRDGIRRLIEQSPAFAGPMDPGVVFLDTDFRPGPNMRRVFVKIESVSVKDDGPWALAGRTATVAFTWKWTEGPYAGAVLRSQAKLNCSSGAWKVYDEDLKQRLWATERGEAD
jgi:hypothetical protein